MLLGELLKARGIKFDVLSRGYGRKSKGVRLVDPAGLPQEFGDEPLLIARKLQVPVIVGERPVRGGPLRRIEIRSATSSARRRLSAPCAWRAISTSCWSRRRMRATDCFPPGGCASRSRSSAARRCGRAGQRRFGGVVSAGGKAGVARAARDSCRRMFRRGRWCSAASRGRRISCCNCGRRILNRSPKRSIATIMPTREKDIRELLALKQRSEAGGFVTTEKDAVNLGAYLSALEPLVGGSGENGTGRRG